MKNDNDDGGEKFLSRWSRLKRDAQVAQPDLAGQSNLPDATATLQRQEKEVGGESTPPQLPPVDELTRDSDFSEFFHPNVGEDVRRAALKKLFSDPHFNVMDGLDTYIDDYSKADPVPMEMLAQMRSAQKIFKWARNELEEGETAPAQLVSAPALEASLPASEIVPAETETRPTAKATIAFENKEPPQVADAPLKKPDALD